MTLGYRLAVVIYLFVAVGTLVNKLLSIYPRLRLSQVPTELEPTTIILDTFDGNGLEPIHIFSVADGSCMAYQLVTLLKSLLYHQGRYDITLEGCDIDVRRSSQIVCAKTIGHPSFRPLSMHWLASADARAVLTSVFNHWKPRNTKIYLHEYERYLKHVGSIPSRHYARASTLTKFIVPYILTKEVEKVISFDADVLLNENIELLWQQFLNFKPENAIGGACEQYENCPKSCPSTGTDVPFYGINAGIMLLHLTKLRQMNWWDTWQEEARTQVEEFGYLPIGDQRVINQILRRQPEMYYRLPCEWNVQVHMENGVKCCPVHWIDRLPDETECRNTSEASTDKPVSQAKLVHFNIEFKPETFGYYVPSNNERIADMQPMTLMQLRHRFAQVYYKFRKLPEKCFF